MSIRPVFHDPSGRRGRALRSVLVGLGAAVALLGGSFAIGVLQPPVVEPLPIATSLASRRVGRADASTLRPCATRCPPMATARHVGTPVSDPIVAGFVVQWDAGSRAALKRYGDHLDWVIVEGAFLGRGKPGEITITLDEDLLDEARRLDLGVHLMLTNFGASGFDSTLVSSVVGTPATRAHAVRQLMDVVRLHDLKGVTLDYELVPAAEHPQVLAFIAALRSALAPLGAVVSAALPISEGDGYPLAAYGAALDYAIPMLYDEHADNTEPGPVASAPWFAARLDAVLDAIPAQKVLAGLGQYGYHWRSDRKEAATVSVSEAMALGRVTRSGPWFDGRTRNPYATWRDGQGVAHTVWYLDAATAWNQITVAHATGAAGLAFWRLGGEDATLWRVLARTGRTGSPSDLRDLPNDGVSVIVGEGEVLAVERQSGRGERSVTVDARGYVQGETITKSAGGYLISRGGAGSRRVALTFDDGPDDRFTAPILDTLKSRHAVASFFVVGRQVQRLPELTRRIVAEGHEIGNHSWSHPDFAGLSEQAISMELAATGRVIEAVTGHRPLLFRPPYIGDASPSTDERLRPMAVANELGYRVAGLEIDSKDWFEDNPQQIVANALDALSRKNGRIILLHDAGGDRTSTLAALGPLIDSLRARGYEPTTVAGLLNVSPQAGTPSAPSGEASQRVLNLVALRMASVGETLIVSAFLVALVLGLLRMFGIGTLAALQRFVPRYGRRVEDADYKPMVSVLVPAYNEGRVIARTVRSVLAQEYDAFEVLVIDDGSSDDTADVAAQCSDDPRLRVVRQVNGGKAAALNNGIAHATGDIIVVIDADTLLVPDAIRHLVHPLADSRVGAVAGNAKVGNRVNLITRWQAVEYVTSQNLDRRAFVMLNCITVVPGAIGAWRRSAVVAAGGFRTDTLAEDQDLTLTLLRGGHRVALADRAVALTEAPETFDALLKQRFRWSFGTLQCAWKHRGALLRPSAGALGIVGLPNIWLFQLLFPLLAPAADIALLATIGRLAVETPALGWHAAWVHAEPVLALYAFFLLIDTVTAVLGVAFEPEERLSQALLVPLQRLAYRQVLYLALVKAMRAALKGWAPGWGKLERTGHVTA
ncbi:glycosyltransferase [Gemmatimonas sp.]|uniref:glycosyltransferase n=1 Tax=Gemmatimonas sp. TaxID=1962908 RepID=UPI00286EA44C|nr:glycosyltransferase [Gemmatimonas sp.]